MTIYGDTVLIEKKIFLRTKTLNKQFKLLWKDTDNMPKFTIDKSEIKLFYHDECDKYDYLTSVACGAIAGLIDIFLVETPENSVLGKWTDKQTDMAVVKFAKKLGWKPKNQDNEPSNEVANAIQFLEGLSKKQRTINYEQTSGGDVGHLFRMSTKNHHLKSLAHSPDIIGLFFSIINQLYHRITRIAKPVENCRKFLKRPFYWTDKTL